MRILCNSTTYGDLFDCQKVSNPLDADACVFVVDGATRLGELAEMLTICEESPSRAYFYVKSGNATVADLLEKYTLNVFTKWAILHAEVMASWDTLGGIAVELCILDYTDNLNMQLVDEVSDIANAVLDSINRFGMYAAATALFDCFEKNKFLGIGIFNQCLKRAIQYSDVEKSVACYRETNSNIESVLKAIGLRKEVQGDSNEWDALLYRLLFKVDFDSYKVEDRARRLESIV